MGVVAASVVGGWGSGETAPPQPSAGLAETADGHTITADAATQAEERNKNGDVVLYLEIPTERTN